MDARDLLAAVAAGGIVGPSDAAAALGCSLSTALMLAAQLRAAGMLSGWALTEPGRAAAAGRAPAKPATVAASEARLCAACRKRAARPEQKTCAFCAERAKEYQRAHRDRVAGQPPLCRRCQGEHLTRQCPDAVRLLLPRAAPGELPPLPAGDAELLGRLDELRPRRRGDCEAGPRPCPWVSCRHHLLWFRSGAWYSTKQGRVAAEDEDLLALLDEMPATCALDAADSGPLTLDEVGQILGVTRERIRQIEAGVLDPDVAVRLLHMSPAKERQARARLVRLRVLAGDALPEASDRGTIWERLESE